MSKISTAEQLFKTEYSIMDSEYPEMAAHVRRKVIEFARLHVEAALKAAAENAETKEEASYGVDEIYYTRVVDKDSIINAYPLTNIK
jgi:hypothetical protein